MLKWTSTRRPFLIKEEAKNLQVLARKSRLGELDYVLFIFFLHNCINYSMYMHDRSLTSLEICVSGIFSETAWRAMNCRQATHPFMLVSRFLKRNRLAAWSWPPGDACLPPSFWVSRWRVWRLWTSAKQRELNWFNFGVLRFLGWFWSRRKKVLSVYK